MNDRAKSMMRPRYFPRQMITPDDLAGGVDYVRARMQRHNRAMHGWGVVYGAAVQPVIEPNNAPVTKVRITPGFIITPQGDEIEIFCDWIVNTTRMPTPTMGADCNDPWTSEVYVDRRPADIMYLAISYKEVQRNPIRVAPPPCGCSSDGSCENSRLQDSFVVELLDNLPESHAAAVDSLTQLVEEFGAAGNTEARVAAVLKNVFNDGIAPTPPIPTDPWVILAKITFADGVVDEIDFSNRRMAASLRGLRWKLSPMSIGGAITAKAIEKPGATGTMTLTLDVPGVGFVDPCQVRLIADVRITVINSTASDDGRSLTVTAEYPGTKETAVDFILVVTRTDGVSVVSDKTAVTHGP